MCGQRHFARRSGERIMKHSQHEINGKLISASQYLGTSFDSEVIPLHIDISKSCGLLEDDVLVLEALEIEAASIAIRSLASLAKINELDHLGGGLDLIPALLLTLAVTDYQRTFYTIEHAHTSIGYYSSLAALGFLNKDDVIDGFRRGIDFPGHVSWVPGGTELNGGRLGIMVPVAVGLALSKKAINDHGSWVVTHCGDAGWISGQALNGFVGASLHEAPTTFVMHRNGIQLSGSTNSIMAKDPRKIIESMGITIIETPSLHKCKTLYKAYQEGFELAQSGKPNLIYPTGSNLTIREFADHHGIIEDASSFAEKHNVSIDSKIWIPGSLMSYRDVESMLECIFLVNELRGGAGHHDGHMKERDVSRVLNNPMLRLNSKQKSALANYRSKPKRNVKTQARPKPGTSNLVLDDEFVSSLKLPETGKVVSARAGVEIAYAAIAETYPEKMFVVSCDLDPSTKLSKARGYLKSDHQFEMSIQEQASALIANGLAYGGNHPQLNVFSTFAAFFEGIAREGFELWRYQRNLTGVNEGLNVTFHLSHVGSCTGRDHFSGWSLDWITLALGYLPYLHRFYAPADAISAFIAVRDLSAHYGGHIIGIPRDNLPILEKQDGSGPLWASTDRWVDITEFRKFPGAKRAILVIGAPAFLADQAAFELNKKGIKTDVYIINGLPISIDKLSTLFSTYSEGFVTVEDGIIADANFGLRGFASVISSSVAASGQRLPLEHIGITDPRIAPSEGHLETWQHFGITAEAIVDAISSLT